MRKIAPTPVSCTVCPNLCFILSHTPQFEGKRNRYQMWQVYVFFPWYLTVHFALEGLEHLSKVLALCFWGTYPCGMSVSFHSAQASLCNFHIMAVVDRLLGLTVNMFEKLSSWWKKIRGREREPPYICNSMLNCKCILKMHRPTSSHVTCSTVTAYVNIWSSKINVKLSLYRSWSHYYQSLFTFIELIFTFNAQ